MAQKSDQKDKDATKERDQDKDKGKGGKDDESKELLPALDACLTSATLNIGVGFLGGFLGSMIVRRRWPIIVGLGFGVGQSIGACREEFEEDGDGKKKGDEDNKNDKDKGKGDKDPKKDGGK